MFYVSLEDARERLLERYAIRSQVEAWWEERGLEFPQVLLDETKQFGLNVRQLASCRYEDLLFITMCERGGLTPLWAPYERDWYVDKSPLKCSYIQPRFEVELRGGKSFVSKLRLANPRACQHKRLDEIFVNPAPHFGEWEEGVDLDPSWRLVNWHRRHLEAAYPQALVNDFSSIYQQAGGKPPDYYPFLLSLFVAHAILIEDYHGGESGVRLDVFTGQIFEPAFRKTEERFGFSPLIVALPWWKELSYYPSLDSLRTSSWKTHPILREYRG